jgi:outer membrane protein insertion porin family
VPIQDGSTYNAEQVDKSIDSLTNAAGTKGYAFAEVHPRIKRDHETRTIDVIFEVDQGPRVYVEKINITGNTRTLDKVIRREFRLVEGDAFNRVLVDRSRTRIKALGFFKTVEIKPVQGSQPDKTVLNVTVEEQSTGQLEIGAGYSSTSSFVGQFSYTQSNLFGRGQYLRASISASSINKEAQLSFTEPYFLDRNLAAGFDLFVMNNNFQYFAQYNQFSYGGVLRAGYQIDENLRQTLRYTLRSDTIDDVLSTASPYIAEEAGTRWTSAIGQTLLYDKRDNRLAPTSGYFASLSNDLAGLGFDTRYFRTIVQAGFYHPIIPNWIFSITGEAGKIIGIGQPVQLEDRFFVGGDNLRGFQVGGVGPHDTVTGDSLGANNYYVGTVNLDFPLGLPEELGVRGHTFVDFGAAWGLDEQVQIDPIGDSPAIRIAPGIGVAWKSPLGPINLDLAYAVKKESYDQRQLLWVSFGTRF